MRSRVQGRTASTDRRRWGSACFPENRRLASSARAPYLTTANGRPGAPGEIRGGRAPDVARIRVADTRTEPNACYFRRIAQAIVPRRLRTIGPDRAKRRARLAQRHQEIKRDRAVRLGPSSLLSARTPTSRLDGAAPVRRSRAAAASGLLPARQDRGAVGSARARGDQSPENPPCVEGRDER